MIKKIRGRRRSWEVEKSVVAMISSTLHFHGGGSHGVEDNAATSHGVEDDATTFHGVDDAATSLNEEEGNVSLL